MIYFDDLRLGAAPPVGPVSVTAEELARFVDITGERHQLHRDGVLPASLLHARTSGALVAARGDVAVVGLRSMTWRCVAPIHAHEPWWVHETVRTLTTVNDDVGIVDVVRQLLGSDGEPRARGELNIAVGRRG